MRSLDSPSAQHLAPVVGKIKERWEEMQETIDKVEKANDSMQETIDSMQKQVKKVTKENK